MAKQQKTKQQCQPTSIDIGRIQPQARELEEAVLGALMIETEAYTLVEDILKPESFYDSIHQKIYTAIINLASRQAPIDMLTVVEQLRKDGELEAIGGPVYIAQLTEKIASAAHIDYHAKIIKQKALARDIIEKTSKIQAKAFDESEDIAEVMEDMEKSLTEIVTSSSNCQSMTMPEALTKAIDLASLMQSQKENGVILAVPTGLPSLDDEFAGGWYAPDLIILGARPSMGKTQHALNFARSAGMRNKEVLFISIEMTAVQLVNRYLLEDSRIDRRHLKTGDLTSNEWTAIEEKAGELWKMKLNIADGHDIRYLNNIRSEARRLKRKGKLDMMIIDYLGLVRTNRKFEKRYQEVGYITGELKNLCKELNIPIMLLSQLSRPPKGTMKEPQLDDLRESGDIEQDADIVMFIHKPDYYEPKIQDSKGVPWKNRGKLLIAKYREGARNQPIIFHHDDRYKKIWDASTHIPQSFQPTVSTQQQDSMPF